MFLRNKTVQKIIIYHIISPTFYLFMSEDSVQDGATTSTHTKTIAMITRQHLHKHNWH